MERLVMCFGIGDGCTYSCDETLPIEYESAEAAIVDFEQMIHEAHDKRTGEIVFAGHNIYPGHFFFNGVYYGPEFYTIDEWFAAKGAQ